MLSFMEAFRWYHQIFMENGNEEKIVVIAPDGVFCYLVIAFRLKNSGTTYTRMVANLFGELLGKSIEVYVDDMLVKNHEESTHADDLTAYFLIMK